MELQKCFSDSDMALMNRFMKTFGHPNAMPMEKYLTHWYNAKSEYLLPMFNNQLTISEQVEYREPESVVFDRVNAIFNNENWFNCKEWLFRIADTVLFKGYTREEIRRAYSSSWHSDESKKLYHEYQKQFNMSCDISSVLCSISGFAQNGICRYDITEDFVETSELVVKPDEHSYLRKPFVIREGQKPFRLINNILRQLWPIAHELKPEEFSETDYRFYTSLIEEFRLKHSNALNTKLLKGELCLSIHPLDFLTASDNASNWTSCMTWTRYGASGEYRDGVVELMHSPKVIVAYLNNDKKPFYPFAKQNDKETSWNNKMWREFFVVTPHYIAAIKGYPYHCASLEEMVLNKLANMAELAGVGLYSRVIHSSDDNLLVFSNGEEVLMETDLMYNDTIDNGSRYLESANLSKDFHDWCADGFYSGQMYCVVCNTPLSSEDFDSDEEDRDHDIPYCDNCRIDEHCASCGAPIDPYPGRHAEIDGELFCNDCYTECFICGKPIAYKNPIEVIAIDSNEIIFHIKICSECYEKYEPYLYEVYIPDSAGLYRVVWRDNFLTIRTEAPDELFKAFSRARVCELSREKLLDLTPYATKILT